jgi:hypothetical protein
MMGLRTSVLLNLLFLSSVFLIPRIHSSLQKSNKVELHWWKRGISDDFNYILAGSPLNLHNRTNLLGPQFSGYMDLREEDTSALSGTLLQAMENHEEQVSATRARDVLLNADDKQFLRLINEESEIQHLSVSIGNRSLLYAPKFQRASGKRKIVRDLIKLSKAMGGDGILFLAGASDLMVQIKKELCAAGVKRAINVVPCSNSYEDGTVNIDSILSSFSKLYPERMDSIALAILSPNFKLSKKTAQYYKGVKVILIENLVLGSLSSIAISMKYLMDLNTLMKSLTSA